MTDAPRPPAKQRRTLAAVIGTAVGALSLFVMIPKEESGRTVAATIDPTGQVVLKHLSGPQYLRAYRDIVQVATACDGITKGIRIGQAFTEVQCTAMLEHELVVHAEAVIACVPQLYGRPNQAAAAVSLAYNIGGPRFCSSTAATLFRARRWREGCEAMTRWNRAGGAIVRGLVLRRARERDLCLRGDA